MLHISFPEHNLRMPSRRYGRRQPFILRAYRLAVKLDVVVEHDVREDGLQLELRIESTRAEFPVELIDRFAEEATSMLTMHVVHVRKQYSPHAGWQIRYWSLPLLTDRKSAAGRNALR